MYISATLVLREERMMLRMDDHGRSNNYKVIFIACYSRHRRSPIPLVDRLDVWRRCINNLYKICVYALLRPFYHFCRFYFILFRRAISKAISIGQRGTGVFSTLRTGGTIHAGDKVTCATRQFRANFHLPTADCNLSVRSISYARRMHEIPPWIRCDQSSSNIAIYLSMVVWRTS